MRSTAQRANAAFIHPPPPPSILTGVYTIDLYKETSTYYQLCICSDLTLILSCTHTHGVTLCYATRAVYLFGHCLFIDFMGPEESCI